MLNLKHKLLTADEEFALGERIQRGDKKAVDQLVTSNLALAISFAKELALKDDDLDDVCSLAFEGLIEAAKRFDPSKKVRFSTYAHHWVKASINRNRLSSSCISAPSMIRWMNAAIRRIVDESQTDGSMSDDRLVELFREKYPSTYRSSAKTIKQARGALKHGISLESPARANRQNGSETSFHEILADDQESAQDVIERQGNIDRVREILDHLIPVYRYVMRMRMSEIPLLDISYQLGFTSRERSRQIEASAKEIFIRSYDSGNNPGSMMTHGLEIMPSNHTSWWELGRKLKDKICSGINTWDKLKENENDRAQVRYRHTLAWMLDREMVKRGKDGTYEVIPVHAVAEVSP